MCGIVGYVGTRETIPILLDGLERLEYRGYDSAGIACIDPAEKNIRLFKAKGKIADLKSILNGFKSPARIGIGHTRWATHGVPSTINAHPHLGAKGRIAVVHNGIVENYRELKSELERKGIQFKSETDTEVIAQLIEYYDRGNLSKAVRRAAMRFEGYLAFVALSRDEPNYLVALKRSNPLVIGIGKGEHFVASDVSAILPYTKQVIYLDDEELVEVRAKEIQITNLKSQKKVTKKPCTIKWSIDQAQKGGYPDFMLKEIYEQPHVLQEILRKRISKSHQIEFDTLGQEASRHLKSAKKICFVSCGTAYHAGMVGQYMFEEFAHLSATAIVASEFRYSDPILGKGDLVILITQSGETADTLAALREAKEKGAFTLAVVNVVGSTIAREADAVVYTHAGSEIGVASTKAYTAQLMTLALLAFYTGKLRGKISRADFRRLILEAKEIPNQVKKTLEYAKGVNQVAKLLYQKRNFLYLGRGYNFPSALEGSLKLKEITYAHAHGYAAGEMKHGPIALIDDTQPVICLIPESKTYVKMLSNIEEIRAREGIVIAIATYGDRNIGRLSSHVVHIPSQREVFSPILTAIPLQILAYQIAVLNSRDVDKPRNLAKSVTVE